ncbi:MAG: twin-arginine translocase subunit TatC [Gemmatimonadaceae bacterium]
MAKPAEMPFLDHLEELRTRLMWALGALMIGVAVGFAVVLRFDVVRLLERPILPYLQGNLIVTHPTDAFKIVMMVSFAFGLVLALPVILYQLWAFLSPALYQHEKKVVVPVLMAAAALFLGGIAIAWFLVLPYTLKFLLTFQASAFDSFIRAEEYFSFATTISLAFGAVFELPIAIMLLTALGIITPAFLHTYRKHAAVLCIVVAAFITPGGDPMSLAAFSVPLYLLFEFSVVLSEVVHRRRKRREAARARRDALEAEQEERERGRERAGDESV